MAHAHAPHHPAALRRPRAVRRPPASAGARLDEVDWGAAGWAGFAAGAAFLVLQSALGAALGGSTPADDARRIAAIALGETVLPEPLTAMVLLATAGVHLLLCLVYARILALVVHGLGPVRCAAIGALFGIALYAVNYYAFTAVFPWFASARGGVALFSHAVFGLLAAVFYRRHAVVPA